MTMFSREQWKSTAAMLVLVFIMVTGGVTAGLYISKKLGVAVWARGATLKTEDLMNATNLKLGDPFPDCSVKDSAGNTIDLKVILTGYKTVIGLVSNGCEACTQFLEAVHEGKVVPKGYRFLLLSTEPEYFRKNYPYPVLGVPAEFIMQQGITMSPTVFGVDEAATLKVISSGHSLLLNPDFMERTI